MFSSIGKKTIVATTGILLVFFVLGHLLGNMTVFLGPDVLNAYAQKLHDLGPALWVIRIGLLGILVGHIYFTMLLWKENQRSNPKKYIAADPIKTTVFSRTMRLSGLVVLAFIVYHLLHFTALQPGINGVGDFSKLQTTLHGETVPDVYATMVLGFRVWWVALAYLIAQGLLFMHLSHGLSAMFQSLGLRNHVWWPRIRAFAAVASALIFLGYASIPVAVLAGGLGQQHVEKAKAQLGLAAAGKEVVR